MNRIALAVVLVGGYFAATLVAAGPASSATGTADSIEHQLLASAVAPTGTADSIEHRLGGAAEVTTVETGPSRTADTAERLLARDSAAVVVVEEAAAAESMSGTADSLERQLSTSGPQSLPTLHPGG